MLSALADDFVQNGFDIRRLIRLIAASEAFRVDSRADFEITDAHERAGCVFPLVRLRPEQVAGSVIQASRIKRTDRESSFVLQLLTMIGNSEFVRQYGDIGEDEFTTDAVTVTQRLLMMNGEMTREMLNQDPVLNASAHIGMFCKNVPQMVETLYLCALNRYPSDAEKEHFVRRLSDANDPNQARIDLVWILMNSSELALESLIRTNDGPRSAAAVDSNPAGRECRCGNRRATQPSNATEGRHAGIQTEIHPDDQSRGTLLMIHKRRYSRRTMLGAGGGLFMASLAKRLAVANERRAGIPKNVILLWMEGGPSQLETFDPHPGGRVGGEVDAIDTTVKGLQISNLLPRTAEQMHRVSLVRSVTSKEGDHARAVYNMKSGFRPDPTLKHPSIGAIVCHSDDRGADIPRHVSIMPGAWPARGGYLGAAYDAFKIFDPANPVPNVQGIGDPDRFDRRVDDLYNVVEQEFRRGRLANLEQHRTLQQTATDAARRMMSSEQLGAFDVSGEPASELARFGDTPFGRGCLAASRLVEVGVRCIEVTLGGWDSHVSNHAWQSDACETLDPALAALLARLAERDLLDSTLVVCGGEFGRTPTINRAEGRDHWPHGFSTLLAGCGVRRGAVHGATAPDPNPDRKQPWKELQDPVTIADIHATILKTLGVDYEHELDTPVGRPMKRSEGTPIEAILEA